MIPHINRFQRIDANGNVTETTDTVKIKPTEKDINDIVVDGSIVVLGRGFDICNELKQDYINKGYTISNEDILGMSFEAKK